MELQDWRINGAWVLFRTPRDYYGIARARLVADWIPWETETNQAWRLPDRVRQWGGVVIGVAGSQGDAERQLKHLEDEGQVVISWYER